jgi:uncharacterized repeat protein (TIGR03806 family)
MKFKFIFFFLGLIWVGLCMAFMNNAKNHLTPLSFKEKLSEYGFFQGDLKLQTPSKGVVPYEINMPLFTDYAYKKRFVVLPVGEKVAFNTDSVLQFPVGTVLIKTFYYPIDERNLTLGNRIIETRLLIHDKNKGWDALTYIWNEDQSDAILEIAGDTKSVSWTDISGKKNTIDYAIPNRNQCKGCHNKYEKMEPIGPSARQLNKTVLIEKSKKHQLTYFKEIGLLSGDIELGKIPSFVSWETADLDKKARAYLDINCAHCHNKNGPASTSGLFLEYNQTDSTAFGFNKAPVAAGKGSGNLKYDIVKGKPKESILLYRMQSLDPGVMMPELGRTIHHKEGIQLIKDWIAKM